MSSTPENNPDLKLADDLQVSLREICKTCEDEDKEIHASMVRQWKKAEEFWHGVQYLFWSSSEDSWRSPAMMGDNFDDLTDDDEALGSFSDKVVDIYKAHGESIIAALSAQIPALRFLPDDADDPADTLTARTYNKVADLIQRHNKAKLVFLRALFFLANQGIVASYRYKDSDPSYGTYKVPVFGEEDQTNITYQCKDCGYTTDQPEPEGCTSCGSIAPPKQIVETTKVPSILTVEDRPKTRIKIDIFGGLHFKVSYYARNQAECNYFGLILDQGKDTVCASYPDMVKEIHSEIMDNHNRFSRSNYVYPTNEEVEKRNLVTVRSWWLRPVAFFREPDEHLRNRLFKKFPKGCKVVFIGNTRYFATAIPEEFDARWEIGQAGLSTYIYSDPILRPLIQIQEMRNQLVNLIMETIEHGIPSEFATPDVVNFSTYNRFEALPGYIYKTLPPKPGSRIGDAFYTGSRATLSREVAVFLNQLDHDAQFAIGSFPSIYGGPSEGKSRTYSEYAASRQMALQRLSIIWNMVVDWWVRTIAGAVTLYTETVVEDERFTQFKDGDYVNVWIKQCEMEGKVGGVEPEGSESFPISLAQKKDLLVKLMEMNNEFVNSALYTPDNARVLQDVLALNDLKLPGECQRVKQVLEINKMLRNKTGPAGEGQSSVPVDMNVDDHAVHIAALKTHMVDTPGLAVAEEFPEVYADWTAHLLEHQQALTMLTMQQNQTPAGQAPETTQASTQE